MSKIWNLDSVFETLYCTVHSTDLYIHSATDMILYYKNNLTPTARLTALYDTVLYCTVAAVIIITYKCCKYGTVPTAPG